MERVYSTRSERVSTRKEAEFAAPTRPQLRPDELRVDAATITTWARSGVLRDHLGMPLVDVAPEMQPFNARGLLADHGTYHEMHRGDATISGALNGIARTIGRGAYTMPVLANESDAERDFRELATAYLGLSADGEQAPDWEEGALRGGIKDHFTQAARCKTYGFSIFEIVPGYATWKGRTVLMPRELKWLAPWSIARWLWVGDELVGVTQVTQETQDYRGSFGVARSLSYSLSRGFVYRDIPIDRILIYQNMPEAENPESTSDLRPLWIPWKAKKDNIIRHESAEETLFKGWVNIKEQLSPSGERFEWITTQILERMDEAADLLVDGQVKRMRPPPGIEVEEMHPEFEIPSPVPMLNYYDSQILLGLAAIILGLNNSHAGSASISRELSSLYLTNLDDSARALVDVFGGKPGIRSTGVLRKIAQWNYPPGAIRRRARLECKGFSDITVLADILPKLEQFKWLTPTAEDEQLIRERMQLPQSSLAALKAIRAAANWGQSSQSGTQSGQQGTQA